MSADSQLGLLKRKWKRFTSCFAILKQIINSFRYKKILGRLKRQSEGNELLWKQITRLLGWMICAKRPLKHYEIKGAFCWRLGGDEDDEDLYYVESDRLMTEVKELCGTLITELSGGQLELVHSTARLQVLPFNQRCLC